MTLLLRRTALLAVVAAVVALAAIGAVRAMSPAALPPIPALAGVPADLATSLGPDLDTILAADQASAAPAAVNPRGQLRRLAAWRRLVHATAVVDLRQGGLTTVQLDHGTISAVAATTLTISETGGGSVTVALDAGSHVRRNGAKASISDLKAADEVFVLSKVEAAGTTAYLVVVPKG